MLTQNQTLKYLEINRFRDFDGLLNDTQIPIPSSFLSFLTTGLRHNTSLQQLSVSIPLNKEIRTFINVISQKNNLTELEVDFTPDQAYSNSSREKKKQIMTLLFYEQVLPAVTNMLESHTTIKLLKIECEDIIYSSQPNWIELVQHLCETIFIHSSLEYIEIDTGFVWLIKHTFENQRKTLIDRHKKEQPHKPLPILNIKQTTVSSDEVFFVDKQSCSFDKLHYLRAVNVIKDMMLQVELNDQQLINLEAYGIKINLLKKYLRVSSSEKMQVTALAGGKFMFPKNTILVSAVYAVSTSIPTPMRLELQHCIDLINQPDMRRYLRFAIASIDSSSPYNFLLQEGDFKSDSWYGSFNFTTNCFICILGLKQVPIDLSVGQQGSQEQPNLLVQEESQQDELQQPGGKQEQEGGACRKPRPQGLGPAGPKDGRKKNDDKKLHKKDRPSSTEKPDLFTQATGIDKSQTFAGQLYYERKDVRDSVKFFAVKNLKALRQHVKEEYPEWEEGQGFRFKFKEEYIELVFDDTNQKYSIKGWCIRPLIDPCTLYQSDVENFGGDDHTMLPLCLITVEASPEAKGTLCYGVPVMGAERKITIYIECYLKTTNDVTRPAGSGARTDFAASTERQEILNCNDHKNRIVTELDNYGFSKGDWEKLGQHLNVNSTRLNDIKTDHGREANTCVNLCIEAWLKTGKATYGTLIEALNGMGENAVANEIIKANNIKNIS
ncbi:PREDICTED: uncharacterized protein LOC109586470 [Amphimedon queenslandica]|nr:PREDICTED: uncharacterized protein LOC109586470 [Amphimedon queenslandica]|eukprot:XP_019858221.1 PREDICTED: uncharacterized protein LOC109586470 [Amphimedon queenslandica]